MKVTGTYISYLHICHRRLWLFAHGVRMEVGSDLVGEGKLIDESTYQRRSKRFTQLVVGDVKVDFYDKKEQAIHEVKRSKSHQYADVAQLKYYLFVLEESGIPVKYGVLEYPKAKEQTELWLTDADRAEIRAWMEEVREIVAREKCPDFVEKPVCRHCAYRDFCYV